jgi:hypothetical protein
VNIIIQGALYGDFTIKVAHEYAKFNNIKKVIISTWEDQKIDQNMFYDDKIILLKNKIIDNGGPGNMNCQIVSSREGIELCDDDLILKTRSDQYLFNYSFEKWIDYYNKQDHSNTLKYLHDGVKQKSKIYIIGNNKLIPFHPQDHFFLGYKQDMQRLFSLPLWNEPAWDWRTKNLDFSKLLRCPIYLGINYYAQFYQEIKKFMNDEKKYLVDNAPNYKEAMDFYLPIKDSIFGVLPRIDLRWEKYNSGYWYSYEKDGEYYAD